MKLPLSLDSFLSNKRGSLHYGVGGEGLTLEKLSKTEDLLIEFIQNTVDRQKNDIATSVEIKTVPKVAELLSEITRYTVGI